MAPDHYKNIRKEAKDRPRCKKCGRLVNLKTGKCWACGTRRRVTWTLPN